MQLLTLAARALFLLLAVLVALRAFFSLLGQHRARKRLMKQLPDAGMVGEMRDIESDKSYPLPREGVLGSGRGCDIRLKGLRRRHVTFAYVPGKGILLTPCHRRVAAWLEGADLRRPAYALHGMLLRVGGYTLCIRLFAGLNVPQITMYEEYGQPAYEEEFFAPDDPRLTAVDTPYGTYWQARQPDGEGIPLFDMTPAGENAVPAPRKHVPTQTSEAPPTFYAEPQPFLPGDDRRMEEADFSFDDPSRAEPADPEETPAAGTPRRHRRSDRRREP